MPIAKTVIYLGLLLEVGEVQMLRQGGQTSTHPPTHTHVRPALSVGGIAVRLTPHNHCPKITTKELELPHPKSRQMSFTHSLVELVLKVAGPP